MKKPLLPILVALAPYLMAALFLSLIWCPPAFLTSVPVPLIFFAVVLLGPILGFLCMIIGLRSAVLPPARLAKWNLAVRLAHIPFYMGNFLLVVLAVPLSAPFFFVIDVMVLLLSAGFAIAAILRGYRDGLITSGCMVLHLVFHSFFVADVVSAFLLWKRLRTSQLD